MLRSCKYCGRIHDTRFDCGKRPKRLRISSDTDEAKFRRKDIWKRTSLSIRARDNNMCQVCRAYFENGSAKERSELKTIKTPDQLFAESVSVHHIKTIRANPELALERTNLITLCSLHHEEAESGAISAEWLTQLATAQEQAD